MAARVVKIGMLGCGVVGGGVVEALGLNRMALLVRLDADVVIERIAVRDMTRKRVPQVQAEWLCTDWNEVVSNENVDVVIEVMGGVEPARTAIVRALENGKDVVTANKELLALHGESLQRLAARLGRTLMCEGSVLGGVPALHNLQSYFVANRINRLRGVVNGTNNYILSRMNDDHQGFVDALGEAQRLGYAEADPTMDIEGKDALYKLQILARIAFDVEISGSDVDVFGIGDVTQDDVEFVKMLGCRLRHVVEGQWDAATGGLRASVRPQVVAPDDALYHVSGADNFLSVEGDLVGRIGLMGPGAGALPTASAVVEDVVKVIQGTAFRLRDVQYASVTPVKYSDYLVRRRFRLGTPAGYEPGFAWRAELGARQVKYLGTRGFENEAWYIRGCHIHADECLNAVSSMLDGEFAVYPAVNLPSFGRQRNPEPGLETAAL